LRDGTWNVTRHGPRPNVLPMPSLPVPDWQPSPAEYDGLGPQARQLLDATLNAYSFDAVEGRLLLLAIRTRSRIEALVDPLPAAVVAILLSGWSAKPPAGAPPDDDDVFELWSGGEAGCARLWQQNRSYLEAVARAWHWTPSCHLRDGTACYFGAWCSVPFQLRACD
jgi:hypothetical protein